MRRVASVLLVAGAGALLASPAISSAGVTRSAAAGDPAGYWTAERIERARPLDPVRVGGPGVARPTRSRRVPFTSGAVPDPTVFPSSANGKLLGRLRGFGPFQCSATVVDSPSGRVILTAGHCVYDPELARFAKRLTFIPAYSDGAAPFGSWAWSELETTRQWVRQANTNFDFATIVLRRGGAGAVVEDTAGGLPLATNGPRGQTYRAVGYPGNRAGAERMWSCTSGYAGPDPRPFPRGKAPIGIGCDMGPGASGGGWVDDAGRLVSVTSFGYREQPDILYGPYLGVKAARLVARAGSR